MKFCSLKRLVIVFCFLIQSRSLFTTGCDQGKDCCNCKDSTECDTFTGSCTSGCQDPSPPGYGWTGQWCHISNIALGRPAEQSSTYRNHVAARAVDGNADSKLSNGHCSHTEKHIINGQYPWWRVDLQELSYINTVTIHNRMDGSSPERLNHFYVRVGNDKDISTHTQCAYHEAAVDETIKINCNKQGRYVSVQLSKDTTYGPFLHMCEVVAMGYKFKECPAGKKPSVTCEEDCNDGNYGSWCNGVCGRCKDSKACDKKNGACPDGCQDWYVGADCSVYLAKPKGAQNARFKSTTSSSITIKWDASPDIPEEGATYLKYFTFYRKSSVTQWTDGNKIQHINTKVHYEETIYGLEHNTKYDFRISARYVVNGVERHPLNSPIFSGQTSCKAPEIRIVNDWRSEDGKYIRINWKVSSECTSLNLMTLEFGHDRNSLTSQQLDTSTGTRSVTNSNLEPHRDYYYILTARNNENLSYSTSINILPAILSITSTTTESSQQFQSTSAKTGGNEKTSEYNPLPMIIIVIMAVLLTVSVLVITILIVRRRRQQKSGTSTKLAEKNNENVGQGNEAPGSATVTYENSHQMDTIQDATQVTETPNCGAQYYNINPPETQYERIQEDPNAYEQIDEPYDELNPATINQAPDGTYLTIPED